MWLVNILIVLISFVAVQCEETYKFPNDFIFTAASAAYQIEGAWDEEGKGPSIWDNMTHSHPELIEDRSNGDVGPDSYHLYKEDIKALKNVGFQVYRFSIAWSRILPNDSLIVNQKGIEYYNKVIDGLLAEGIEPFVTMYHWDLPQYIQDLGGFTSEVVIAHFRNYADILYTNFGDRVKKWITFNEPYNFCQQGYGIGIVAPLVKGFGVGEYLCAHNMLQSHAAAYHLYQDKYVTQQKGLVGISLNADFLYPKDSTVTAEFAQRVQQYRLGWFANPIFSKDGGYPQVMIDDIGNSSVREGLTISRLPSMTAELKKSIQGSADFLGFNYYSSRLVKPRVVNLTEPPSWDNDIGYDTFVDPSWKRAKSEWLYSVPQGLHDILKWIKDNYNNVPVYITENGFSDDGEIEDNGRIEYLRLHLISVANAINKDNCNVKSYTVWSIIDNFEWLKGYTERFGIYSVNLTSPTKERVPKKSVDFVKDVIKNRRVTSGSKTAIVSVTILIASFCIFSIVSLF